MKSASNLMSNLAGCELKAKAFCNTAEERALANAFGLWWGRRKLQ